MSVTYQPIYPFYSTAVYSRMINSFEESTKQSSTVDRCNKHCNMRTNYYYNVLTKKIEDCAYLSIFFYNLKFNNSILRNALCWKNWVWLVLIYLLTCKKKMVFRFHCPTVNSVYLFCVTRKNHRTLFVFI